jgi:hypothetical protein
MNINYFFEMIWSVCFFTLRKMKTVKMCPCHDGMARPQVADGGTVSNMDGSWEYIL